MTYCMEDVIHLPLLWETMQDGYASLDPSLTKCQLETEAKVRGRYSAHTAIMESRGYPIDLEKTRNFSSQVGNILYDCQREINQLFPQIKPFRWSAKDQRFTWDQMKTREWIRTETPHEKDWQKTDGGDLSLSLEAWTRFFDFKHEYPKDNFGAQMVRFLKLKQNIYGFVISPNSAKKNFWDSVGSDGRVRPYLNIYGAQSSRSQPGSSGFMFLKNAWLRALVIPAKGKFMAGIDYGSEEFFISALVARDQNMIDAYLSGDPYTAFGKLAGMIPPEGTKDTHKAARDLCKSTVLGISYLMSKYGLAIKLSLDSGEVWDEEGAQEMIDKFYEAFDGLKEYQEDLMWQYRENRQLKLPCGWSMWGDNPNHRSATNMPVQGFGASIMRKAVDLAVAKGIYIPFTLHDALYMEDDIGNEWKIEVLADCMREAFAFYFDEDLKETASKIRLDPFAWSPDYEKDSEFEVGMGDYLVPCSNLYIDARSEKEYAQFSKYFEPRAEDLL